MSRKEINDEKRSSSTYNKKNPRVSEKKEHQVDQKYVERNPGYKPGVWMRSPSSLENMEDEDKNERRSTSLSKKSRDRIIYEEIQRYINDYNREQKESTRDLKERLENDIRRREKLLEQLKEADKDANPSKTSKRPADTEDKKREIEKHYRQMIAEQSERQREMDRDREKMNALIRRKIEDQDRLLDLQRKEMEKRNERLINEERLKNQIERERLEDLKRQRKELLKQELNELSEIEKHEKKKKLIEEELNRSIKEREVEKERLNELNKKIIELQKKEREELQRIQEKDDDVIQRRRELLDDQFKNKHTQDDLIEVWACDGKESNMCIVNPNDLCVDPFSGRLVIKGDCLPSKITQKDLSETGQSGSVRPNKSAIFRKADGKPVLNKHRYLEMLSSYDPKKLRRKLSYQNWLINESRLDEKQIIQKFPGSEFSLEIDMEEWPAIKQESMRQYMMIKKSN